MGWDVTQVSSRFTTKSFIGLLSPTDNEIATQWRADVLAKETLKTLNTANKVLVEMFGEENN